jgi:hypothetical protein
VTLTPLRLETLRQASCGQLQAWGTVWQPNYVNAITDRGGNRLPGKFNRPMEWLYEAGFVAIEWTGRNGPGRIVVTRKGTATLEGSE